MVENSPKLHYPGLEVSVTSCLLSELLSASNTETIDDSVNDIPW